MKKQYILLLSFMTILLLAIGCSSQTINERISNVVGVEIRESIEIEHKDSHGGFHGDGETVAVIKFNETDGEKIQSDILKSKEWVNLPLSENLSLLMYGGEKNSIHYSYNLAEKLDMPVVSNGYYFFVNRHSNRVSSKDDIDIFNQNSFNFTIAVYDIDTQTMYYLEFDS